LRIWLKKARNNQGLTHEQVADRTGISRSYYTHIEKGTKTPTVPVAQKIGEVLGIEWTLFFEIGCSLEERSLKPA
jgi:transcriptional regulator with XRE-family HTH domain